ncbi:hypothetical protein KIL84_020971 [Mauremys mutica]|uniref:Uncharacterized protein n=1 Tax=Mauremys mutica TaxID=74926 RepID=A0A9D3XB29_9SAUR|nr:hypothetical protein KIL84_020971 [Mauremys mutica]
MEEVHKSTSNSSATPPQTTSIQGTPLQAAHLSHIAQQMSLRGPTPLTVVQLPGEQVQVQGVIQTAQSSVIHSPQVQTVQWDTPHVASEFEFQESDLRLWYFDENLKHFSVVDSAFRTQKSQSEKRMVNNSHSKNTLWENTSCAHNLGGSDT